MEPKPRGIISEDKVPVWWRAAAESYRGPRPFNWTETDFCRADWTIKVLDTSVLPEAENPSILIAGLGLDMGFVPCSYTPFRVAAHLEGRGLNYTMTLIDIDSDVIDDVRNRSMVSLWNPMYVQSGMESYKDAWDKYLRDTGQLDSMAGVTRVASVPKTFHSKLQTGEIQLLHTDIAVADLQSRQFDYVECLNVLYLLPDSGQQLAMANMTQSLRHGGYLLINDNKGNLFSQTGGWLSQSYLDDLRLQVIGEIYPHGMSRPTLFRKRNQ